MGSETKTRQSSTGLDFESTRTNSTGSERADGLKGLERWSLLPLLPDEITTTLIIPRLSWRAIMTSAQLNCSWRAALRSPMVHKLRAQAITSQTIVTIPPFDGIISLYDTATGTWHRRLPRIPLNGTAIRTFHGCAITRKAGWRCVTLLGKLYILEGSGWRGEKLHVFDVAGQGQWKECARMKHARTHFACGAFDGKIYVFGGGSAGGANMAEVYDPEQDLWSDLAPMLSQWIEHKLVIIGDLFCIYGGRCFQEGDTSFGARWNFAQFAEIYDTRTDNWTKVANFAIGETSKEKWANMAEAAVVIGGKLHRILDEWLYVYEEPLDCSKKTSERLRWDGSGSWKAVQPISWDVFHLTNPSRNPYARLTVAISNYGELFAVVFGPSCTCSPNHTRQLTGPTDCPNHRSQWTFLESKGLGAVGQTITWQRIPEGRTLSSRPDSVQLLCPPCILSMAGPW